MIFHKVANNQFFVNLFGAVEKSRTFGDFLRNYILAPLNNGLIGFAIGFTVIIFVRIFDRLFLGKDLHYVTLDDLATASIGMMIFGLGRIILNMVYGFTQHSH